MKPSKTRLVPAAGVLCILPILGCQPQPSDSCIQTTPSQSVASQFRAGPAWQETELVQLTADPPPAGQPLTDAGAQTPPEALPAATAASTTRPASTPPATTQPATESSGTSATTQPAATPQRTYTVPGAAYRQLSLAVGLAAATPTSTGLRGGGRELSEASIGPGTGGGIAALGAPQPRTLSAVVGQPGIQRGLAIGLGPIRPNNLLTARANPLTGPNGRCQDLVRAGLFTDAAACHRFFGK